MTAPLSRLPPAKTAPAIAGLVAAVSLVYANTFSVPFVFDDIAAITQNPSIERFATAFSPPEALSVTGRPVANLSLALSHALSGSAPWGYHAVNLAIHLLATLTLFGLARRMFCFPVLRPRFGAAATPLAFGVALLWAVHPLQTASVTYVMQRTEVLMGLCYLLVLYTFVRAMDLRAGEKNPGRSRTIWLTVSVAACLVGMGTKEVMISAPLIVLLCDRTFVAGTARAALRQRGAFYAGLAATWLLLAYLVLGTENRGASAGFGSAVTPVSYALTQFSALTRYLGLVVWPHPLVFDYGNATASGVKEVILPLLIVGFLLGGTMVALWQRPALGFAGAVFFAVLAPTSSFVPIATQTIAEHRIYLPLAVVLSLAVTGLHAWLGRWSFAIWAVAALGLGGLTLRRNADYRSERSLWTDTVKKAPGNARAHYNLGTILLAASERPAAIAAFRKAIDLQPHHAEAHAGLARALAAAGRPAEALPHFEAVVRLGPASSIALINLGNALLQLDRPAEAFAHFERARELSPSSPASCYALGNALVQLGRFSEAVAAYEAALRLNPADPATHYNLGNTLAQLGRYEAALAQFEEAVRLAPQDPAARSNLDRLRAYLRK